MPQVQVDGAGIWYEDSGDGPPLVLTGGFGLLHNQFDFVRDELVRTYRTIDWNYRGAGRSDRAWPGRVFHLDRWVDDLEAVLAHLGVSDVVLWGTSTGSQISIRYAARYPQRVRALAPIRCSRPTWDFARHSAAFGRSARPSATRRWRH